MSRRLFIAYKLPTDLRNELLVMQHKMKNNLQLQGISWVKPENMHITIAFLGQVEDRMIPNLEGIIRAQPFGISSVRGDRMSFFSRNNIPSILYYALVNTEELAKTANDIRGRLVDKNIDFDRKVFNPHITIARIKDEESGSALKEYVSGRADSSGSVIYKISSITLYESRFSENGPQYVSLFEKNQEV
ncbi:TPA: RNA 2',3'-cyclic phosphodiesterase [candidate division WOR-3 bacterium]|jgi:2'-5' RNA ligase|uniref:RNA 2',3'-cyclic phosphodiesterase n=1 Tax=candidate division WOR-3 bacterium TaxID=2052148 RepID=A0A350H8E6_UNCW3|nr:RNA 2',3'-cyclic phosphodiesterase [candidate division WOR-3 bacterium]